MPLKISVKLLDFVLEFVLLDVQSGHRAKATAIETIHPDLLVIDGLNAFILPVDSPDKIHFAVPEFNDDKYSGDNRCYGTNNSNDFHNQKFTSMMEQRYDRFLSAFDSSNFFKGQGDGIYPLQKQFLSN